MFFGIPEDPAKMPRDQRSSQKVFRELIQGAFLEKHCDKILHMDRFITQTSHIQINFSELFRLWVEILSRCFFFGTGEFLRGLPVSVKNNEKSFWGQK